MRRVRLRWLAACLVSGLIGNAPVSLGGMLVSAEVFASVVSSVFVVVTLPALLTVPRRALSEDRREHDAELPWKPFARASVFCSALTFAVGFLFDNFAPVHYWVDGSGIFMSISILLFASLFATRSFYTRRSSVLVVAAAALVTLIYALVEYQASSH